MAAMRRGMGAFAAAAVLAVGAGACGSEDPEGGGTPAASGGDAGGSPAEILRQAFTATGEQDSADIAVNGQISAQGQTVQAKLTGTQSFDEADPRATYEATASGGGLPSGATASIRYLSGTAYAKIPTSPQWLSIDVEALRRAQGGQAEQQQLSAEQAVQLLERAGSLEDAGSETIDGDETTHIRGEVTLRGFADAVPGPQRQQLQQLLEQARSDPANRRAFETPFPVDFYVSEDDTLRRIGLKFDISASGGRANGQFTVDLTEYGTDVAVQAPPASQTQELPTDGLSGLGAGAGASAG